MGADVAVEVPRTSWNRCELALYRKTRSVPESIYARFEVTVGSELRRTENRATTTLDAVTVRNARTVDPLLASTIRSEYAPLRATLLSAVGVPVTLEKMPPPAVETTPCSIPVSQADEERKQSVAPCVVALCTLE